MTMDHFDEEDHFFTCTWRQGLSDWERMRYLRGLIDATTAKLDAFRNESGKNADSFAFEEVVLASAMKELRKLEFKFSMI
jgi:hypothetical protein